jgi:hypothetical protein
MKNDKHKSELKKDLKIVKKAKAKSKALDFFKNGIGRMQARGRNSNNFPPGHRQDN